MKNLLDVILGFMADDSPKLDIPSYIEIFFDTGRRGWVVAGYGPGYAYQEFGAPFPYLPDAVDHGILMATELKVEYRGHVRLKVN